MNDFYDRLTAWLAAGLSILAGLVWKSNEAKHKAANAALGSLITALSNIGLIVDTTT